MQVSLNIQDDLYNKVISSGIDMQSKFDQYLRDLLNTKQFQEDKQYFQKALEEIRNGDVELVPFEEGLDELDDFIDNVK